MPAQKDAIGLADLKAMVKATGHASPIAARNSAILLFGWATALRRSNLAALRLEHLTFTPKGILEG
jgi:integrase